MNNLQNCNLLDKKNVTISYCKYCLEERGKTFIIPRAIGWLEVVSKKTYEQLEPTFSASELQIWKTKEVDRKKRICRTCYENKKDTDLVVKEHPNFLYLATEAQKEQEKKQKTEKLKREEGEYEDSSEESEVVINQMEEQMIKEGWIGPSTRTCIDPSCKSTIAYIKIRPPLSDDEPPLIIYRCALCLKTNFDYKQ